MVDQDYKRARATAVKELEELLETQKQTEQRILQLRNTIAALDSLADPSQPRKKAEMPRLTEAIRSIFKAAAPTDRFSPIDIRNKLLEMGFREEDYSNFLASVHVTVRRLKQNGEIKLVAGRSIFGPKDDDWLAEI